MISYYRGNKVIYITNGGMMEIYRASRSHELIYCDLYSKVEDEIEHLCSIYNVGDGIRLSPECLFSGKRIDFMFTKIHNNDWNAQYNGW